jgi:hypothetical protein
MRPDQLPPVIMSRGTTGTFVRAGMTDRNGRVSAGLLCARRRLCRT